MTTYQTTLTRHGTTIEFTEPVQASRYVNGDYAIKLPATIKAITPNGAGKHGAMLNPSPQSLREAGDYSRYAQGYDASMAGCPYVPELNVAAQLPRAITEASSLVCSVSRPEPGIRPQLETASVWTFVHELPDKRTFRPSYTGYNLLGVTTSSVLWRRLPSLRAVGTPPNLRDLERSVARVWLDHVPDWVGRELHPRENMPDYGRNLCAAQGLASLYLCSDAVPFRQKRRLLVGYLQMGLDMIGVAMRGGDRNWPSGGGHGTGRKWPILFTTYLFGGAIDLSDIYFLEDGSTFYVDQESIDAGGGYAEEHLGMPEWGNKHAQYTSALGGRQLDDVRWTPLEPAPWLENVKLSLAHQINQGLKYRRCCTATAWLAQTLSCLAMGLKDRWDHDAYFDYVDRWRDTEGSALLSWDRWPLEMWDAHRATMETED